MLRKRKLQFYCFSPPVMVATAAIELSLMVYTLWKYRSSRVGRIAAVLLLFLAVFQVAEYNVCGGLGLHAATWSRIGFMAISVLPALGIHLALAIGKVDKPLLRWLAYGNAAIWVVLFGFSEAIFANHNCGGNYIIFHIKPGYGSMYFLFYYFWLFVGIATNLWLIRRVKARQARSLRLLIIGYLLFMIPTAVVNTLNPVTIEGLPSILCGFAVFFAALLAFGILPNELVKKSAKHKR